MLTLSCKRMVFAVAAACFVCMASAATYQVNSIASLQSYINSAAPGDRIIVADGTYTTSGQITVNRVGTATQPIVIEAATIGGVTIAGTHGFALNSPAAYVTIQGFKCTHAGNISIGSGTSHCRFVRNIIELAIPAGSDVSYFNINGDDVELDHNELRNKSTFGNMLDVAGSGSQVARRLWVHHNYFHDFTQPSGSGAAETIRLGLSGLSMSTGDAIVEYNLFVRCNGENELISNKSCGNTYRYNTLIDSPGAQLTLRHGNDCFAYGNYFRNTDGLRIFGDRHQIFSNYFEGNTKGVDMGNGDGEVADGALLTCHDRPDNCVVTFNTFINNSVHYQMGGRTGGLGATNVTVANNIMQGGGSMASISSTAPYTGTWSGNIGWNTGGAGSMPSSGYTTVNPLLAPDARGVFHIQSGSPAINAAVGSYPYVTVDMDGQPRDASPDVGADEFSNAPQIINQPLTTNDVGPNAVEVCPIDPGTPKDQLLTVGSDVIFEVVPAAGSTILSYQWYEIIGSNNQPIGGNSPLLIIPNAQASDAGRTFLCRIVATKGSYWSSQAHIITTQVGTTNIALGKSTTASSVYGSSYGPEKAVDGSNGTFWNSLGTDAYPWWRVDLGTNYAVAKVDFINRTTSTATLLARLSDLQVEVLNASQTILFTSSLINPGNITPIPSAGTLSYLLPVPISGRYVRVTKMTGTGKTYSDNMTNIAEIQVYVSQGGSVPAAPQNLTAVGGYGYIALDWADNTEPDFSSYVLYRSATPGTGYTRVTAGLTGSSYTDTGLDLQTRYYYVVRTENTAGALSGFSGEKSALPRLPGDLNANGKVDWEDFAILARDWGKTSGTYPGDISGPSGIKDGNVNLYDLVKLAEDWLEITTGIPNRLEGHWKLDDLTGTAAADSSGNLRHGTLQNGPVWTSSGKLNGALQFDGVNDYVEIIGYKGITGTSSRTCSAWIKTGGSAANMVIADWGAAAAGQKWLFGIFTTGKLVIYTWTPYIQTNITVTDNQWHHVAAVLIDDGTPDVSEVKLYIDGLLQAAAVSSAQAINTVPAADVLIGACDNAGTKGFYFNGLIDDVRIYSAALSQEQIIDIASQP